MSFDGDDIVLTEEMFEKMFVNQDDPESDDNDTDIGVQQGSSFQTQTVGTKRGTRWETKTPLNTADYFVENVLHCACNIYVLQINAMITFCFITVLKSISP